jgi:hypothetical protein
VDGSWKEQKAGKKTIEQASRPSQPGSSPARPSNLRLGQGLAEAVDPGVRDLRRAEF